MKILVAYFSATGVTAKKAKELASAVGADTFEIVPEQPYSAADIRWTVPLARCNREKLGKKDVPIKGSVENMADYDLILIGFPIWYYCAPNIINTFVKQYDFSGKKIGLFATSGGSNMGKTADKLKPYLSDSAVIAGTKLLSDTSDSEMMKAWVNSL